ncbi:MAG: extracellular solute-binding protein [candidate division Zixibacteria bacterium]|nr:extracellular solute-binding protein [candidate division Zixibacteria bacterium]
MKTLRKLAVLLTAFLIISILLFSCTDKKYQSAYILTNLSDNFSQHLSAHINEIAEEYGYKINLINIEDKSAYHDSLLHSLKSSTSGPLLAFTDASLLKKLPKEKLITGISSVFDENYLKENLSGFSDYAVSPGIIYGKLFYYPFYTGTILLFYNKSDVRDAVGGYKRFHDEIDSIFKLENYVGLPAGYTLEFDPAEWDFFDIFVAGYYWSHNQESVNAHPSVAQPGGHCESLIKNLLSKNYSLGAKDGRLLNIKYQSAKELLRWESLYYKYHIYDRSSEDSLKDGGAVAKMLINGKISLCCLDNIEFFNAVVDSLFDRASCSAALVPCAMSADLTENGEAYRTGYRYSVLDGQWMAIPANSPDKELSAYILMELVSDSFQEEITRLFGAYPVLSDLTEDFSDYIKDDRKAAILNAIKQQVKSGVFLMPDIDKSVTREFYNAYRIISFRKSVTDPIEITSELFNLQRD